MNVMLLQIEPVTFEVFTPFSFVLGPETLFWSVGQHVLGAVDDAAIMQLDDGIACASLTVLNGEWPPNTSGFDDLAAAPSKVDPTLAALKGVAGSFAAAAASMKDKPDPFVGFKEVMKQIKLNAVEAAALNETISQADAQAASDCFEIAPMVGTTAAPDAVVEPVTSDLVDLWSSFADILDEDEEGDTLLSAQADPLPDALGAMYKDAFNTLKVPEPFLGEHLVSHFGDHVPVIIHVTSQEEAAMAEAMQPADGDSKQQMLDCYAPELTAASPLQVGETADNFLGGGWKVTPVDPDGQLVKGATIKVTKELNPVDKEVVVKVKTPKDLNSMLSAKMKDLNPTDKEAQAALVAQDAAEEGLMYPPAAVVALYAKTPLEKGADYAKFEASVLSVKTKKSSDAATVSHANYEEAALATQALKETSSVSAIVAAQEAVKSESHTVTVPGFEQVPPGDCDKLWLKTTEHHFDSKGAKTTFTLSNTPLPPVPLAYMESGGRILVIGDVHGCYDELCHLLAKCKYEQGVDRLIFLGDLVDRGPHSLKAFRLAFGLGVEVIMGNHERRYLDFWECQMGFSKRQPPSMKKHHMELYEQFDTEDFLWMASWPSYLDLGEHPSGKWLAVHGGFLPAGAAETPKHVCENLRWLGMNTGTTNDASWKQTWKQPGSAPFNQRHWSTFWKGPNVVFGHCANNGPPHVYAKTVSIDGACVGGGHLVALDVTAATPQFWRVAANASYSPIPRTFWPTDDSLSVVDAHSLVGKMAG